MLCNASRIISRATPAKRAYVTPRKIPNRTSLYVHWPYCKSICPYCDFNRYLADKVDHARMKDAMLRELDSTLDRYYKDEPVQITSIFFGGGTPSLALPETFKSIIELAKSKCVDPSQLKEITMEANPTVSIAHATYSLQVGGKQQTCSVPRSWTH